jgi:hypothetical protein
MKRPLPAWTWLLVLVACAAISSASAAAGLNLMQGIDEGGRHFDEIEISEKMVVYFHQRTVGEATVEKDFIVYQFDRQSGELLARKSHWRDGVPDRLPPVLLTAEQAAAAVDGTIRDVRLYILSPESDVFPLDPAPTNPCWVVYSLDAGGALVLSVIDAVDGSFLGNGAPPPYSAFSLTGPQYSPCAGAWDLWSQSARTWFDAMGYTTEEIIWPLQSAVQSHVQSVDTAMFYELAHGGSYYFASGCVGGTDYEYTYASEIESWMSGYTKMPFAFIGSCGGMCSTGNNTFAYEFRKGSDENTTVVGYCNMAEPECSDCWNNSLGWQNTLFYYMNLGWSVKDAFDQANADFPMCATSSCMRFAGDTDFAVVPVVGRAPGWNDVTSGALGDPGDGTGVAWGDYDGDGHLDLYLANDGANKLLRNDGAGGFADVTAGPLGDAGAGRGVAWGDYDNDEDPDLYVANYGTANVLLRNDGAGGFTDVTSGPLGDAGNGVGVAWADYDKDGDLDVYVANYGSANVLLRNDTGTFADATSGPLGDAGNGTGIAWGDYDNDGDPDVYLVNCGSANKLFRNDGGGAFVDVTGGPLADADYGWGVAWGDYDNDGDHDLYLANDGTANKLLRNDGGAVFTDVTSGALADAGGGRGVAWGDYDNDGDLDLYLGNDGGANVLLRNDGGGAFVDGTTGPLGDAGDARGVAWGDYDGDGELDLYLANYGSANTLIRNDTSLGNNWLHVDPAGVFTNRSAIGARVRIVAGGASQFREILAGSGMCSQNSTTAEFGVGSTAIVDTVVIVWPSGVVDVVSNVSVNQLLPFEESPWDVVSGGPLGDGGGGKGVAWGDYDGDGDLDVYLAGFGTPSKLFRNDGGGVFADATAPPLGGAGTSMAVAWGDYDNDGDVDLYAGNFGANALFRNDGGGVFTDVASGAAADAEDAWSVAWVDYDADGDLDLYVANAGAANVLLRNDGGGTLVDATTGPLGDAGAGRGTAWSDYDADGDLDLYLANLGGANKLLRNDGSGVFVDATAAPLDDAGMGMGVAWGDYDNDGDPDLYLGNFGTANRLFRNDGGAIFVDVTSGPLGDTGKARGVSWGDYDGDGELDLYVANHDGANVLLRNQGGGIFEDATVGPLGDEGNSFGVAWADYDGDGELDLYLANTGTPDKLLRNDCSYGNRWLAVDLVGVSSNRSAVGAEVVAVAGGLAQTRSVSGGHGLASQCSMTLEFGLGSAASVDTLSIRWPSGAADTHVGVAADQHLTYYEGGLTGADDDVADAGRDHLLHGNFPNPFNPMTRIRYELPAPAPVSLRVYSISGRLVRVLLDSELRGPGTHTTEWDGTDDQGRNVASGVYFYRLEADGERLTRKMILLK